MARGTMARFARWERSAKAGAIAALVLAEMATHADGLTSRGEMEAEIELLMADADRVGVRDLVDQIVHNVPRLPPAKPAADLRYQTLDRLHKRLVTLVFETGKLRAGETDPVRCQILEGQQRDLAEESDALAAVLDEVLKAAHQERRDAADDAARAHAEAQARDEAEADRASDADRDREVNEVPWCEAQP